MDLSTDTHSIVPSSELDANDLSNAFAAFHEVTFQPGELVIAFRQRIDHVGLIHSGVADVYFGDWERHRTLGGSIGPGDFLGDFACLTDRISVLTIICRETMTASMQSCEDFIRCINAFDKLKNQLLISLVKTMSMVCAAAGFHRMPPISARQALPRTISKGLSYIDKNLDRSLTLEAVSREAGMSRFAFSRSFKRYMGVSFKDHINSCKIAEAKRLINGKGFNVTEACFAVGFNDVSYFSKVFRKFDGRSPSAYKKTLNSVHNVLAQKDQHSAN